MFESFKNHPIPFRAGTLFLTTLVVACCFGLAPSAQADTTYTYTGNLFTQFFGGDSCNSGLVGECRITGSFTVAQALGPNFAFQVITPKSWSFTDGNSTIDNSNTLFVQGTPVFQVGTDANGDITKGSMWNIRLDSTANPAITLFTDGGLSSGVLPVGVDQSFVEVAACSAGCAVLDNDPGTWNVSSSDAAVPEPTSVLLVGSGLLGLIRRKRVN